MIYSLDEIKKRIAPVAQKYDVPAVWIFGSYARGEADENSDVDILFQREGSKIHGLLIGALYEEMSESLGKKLDLVTLEAISTDEAWEESPWFIRSVYDDRVKIYESN